jgi:type IV secretion system protein VirB10
LIERKGPMNSKAAGMQLPLVAALLIATVSAEPTLMAAGIQIPQQGPPSPAPATITITAGTVVPLTLVSPIKSKSTKVGDAVRAVVAFPIAAGDKVAIPAGTFVEGMITSLTARAKGTHQPDVQIHFTRLLYANGYAVALDAANTRAAVEAPGTTPRVVADNDGMAGSDVAVPRTAVPGSAALAFAPQATTPTLPPLPSVGPPKGPIIGAVFGGFAAFTIATVLVARHLGHNTDYLLFDAGWQCQMKLQSPLSVDAAQVAAAAVTPLH